MVSWTLLAMALALLLGVTIRRVQPAMIAFAGTFGGCLVLAQTWPLTHSLPVPGGTTRVVVTVHPTRPLTPARSHRTVLP